MGDGYCAALRSMLRESWLETYGPELDNVVVAEMTETLSSDGFGELVLMTDEQSLIATRDGEVTGSAISVQRHATVYFWGCYVPKRRQRKGIGSGLVRKAIAVDHNWNVASSIAVKSSIGARKFYKSLGFKVILEGPFENMPGPIVPSLTMCATKQEFT